MRLQKPVFIALLIFLVLTESACPKNEQMINSQPEIQKSSPNDVTNKEVTEKMIHHFTLGKGWIPIDKNELQKTIKDALGKVELKDISAFAKEKPRGLVVPHAGYAYSAQCAAYSYKTLEGKSYKRVFVLGPNHSVYGMKGVSVTKATHYETPLGEVPIDTEVCKALLQSKFFDNIPETERGEHSVEIQIPFLQTVLKDFKLVPIVVGEMSLKEMQQVAETIQPYVDEDTLVVASSDFMHYGKIHDYTPFTDNIKENIHKTDQEGIFYITTGNINSFLKYLDKTKTTICGWEPISLLMMIFPGAQSDLLHYYTSGDLNGRFDNSVSYAAIALNGLTKGEQSILLKLARQTIQICLKEGKKPKADPDKLPSPLKAPRCVFVTLKENHQLRGCIGCLPKYPGYVPPPLYQAVIDYAINSAVNDSRFSPMTLAEEPNVDIEISVLSPLTKVKGPEDIIIGKHGTFMVRGGVDAVFLPQVAPEQGWDRNTMLTELSLKATYGQDDTLWKDKDTIFYVFTAQVFGEKE